MSLAQLINYRPNQDSVTNLKDVNTDDLTVKGTLTFNKTEPDIKLTIQDNNLSLLNSNIDLSNVKIITEQQTKLNTQEQEINLLKNKVEMLELYISKLQTFMSNFKDIIYMEKSSGIEFDYSGLI